MVGDRRQDVHDADPKPTLPVRARRATRASIRNLADGRRDGDRRTTSQFTRAGPGRRRRDEQLVEAMRDAAATSSWPRPRPTRPAADAALRRSARASRTAGGVPGDHARGQGRRRPRPADALRPAEAHELPARGGRGASSAGAIDTPDGPHGVDRLRRARRARSRTSASSTSSASSSTPPTCAARSSSSAPRRPSLQDLHDTSTTRNVLMPGPEIQANAIATALAGFPLHEAPWWLNVLLVVALGVTAPLVGAAARRSCRGRRRRRRARRVPGRRAARVPARGRDRHRRLPAGGRASPAILLTGGDPRPDRGLRARAGARRVRALRARGGRRPGAGRRRRRAPRRRARRGHGHVQRPARVHVVLARRSSRSA